MTFELWILVGSVFLGLVHILVASFSFKAQVGNDYTIGSRDDGLMPTGVAARLQRAQTNYMESFPFFAALVTTVFITDTAGGFSFWGSSLYLLGRIAFLPFYAVGIRWIRTISWKIATLGLVLVGIQIPISQLA